jgi:hypothetical protein
MLPAGRYVQEVALGDDGLIQGFAEGALLLNTSSSEPWLTVETIVSETLNSAQRPPNPRDATPEDIEAIVRRLI